jgi:tetratricopeptide (TPR) repeat protein
MTDVVAEATDHPANKKENKWNGATWLALASAVTAIVAAGISLNQVHVAAEQNTAAEQEQLVTLTTTITNQLAQTPASATSSSQSPPSATSSSQSPSPATSSSPSPSSQSSAGNLAQVTGEANAEQGVVAALSADGQAAAVLINSLHGDGVAGIEYVEVALALEDGGEVDQAITFFKDAIAVSPGDVETRGDALRYMGALYYMLGRNVTGHQDMVKAARIFAGRVVLTHFLKEESIAEGYLGDAYFQLLVDGCRVAITDLEAALQAVRAAGLKTAAADPTLFALADEDAAAAHAKCLE